MKSIITILSLLFIQTLYSVELPVMLKIKSKIKIPNDFRNGVESILSKNGYTLIDLKQQEEVLSAQSDTSEGCLDDSCLIDTGKMLAAKELFLVEVSFKDSKKYSFTIRVIDLEKNTTGKIETLFYNNYLTDSINLFNFAKRLTKMVLSINTPKTAYVVPVLHTDLIIASKYLSLDIGAGFKLIKYNILDFSTLGVNFKFYRDFTDEYFYSDFELQYKLNFFRNKLAIGLSIPFRILFNENTKGKMGFNPGLIFEYNLFKMNNGFFINLELAPFYSISLENIDKKFFFKTGLTVGWVLF